jgi:DNA-binding response OmpR family regulator
MPTSKSKQPPPKPANTENAAEADVELAVWPAPAATPRPDALVILVVDDDPDIRAMLVVALGKTYTIYEATDGIEAKEVLDAIPAPDAIVCDVMMPRLDGVGFAKALRKDKNLSRIPILFLTAKDGTMDVIAGINAGARHYVTKPFKIADVLAKVAMMTGKKR